MEYNGLEVVITYKRIKHLNARVRDNRILISAPFFTSDKEIERFINSISKRLDKRINNQVKTDENVMYLWGKKYNVIQIESNEENKIIFMEDMAYVFYRIDPKEVIDDYYKKETLDKINYIAIKYKELMSKEKILFSKISIKKLTSRWGSCNVRTKNITINSNLAKYDPLCLEYVFCHEIAHIKYHNHSKSFHDFIYSYFEYEKQARKELKKYY